MSQGPSDNNKHFLVPIIFKRFQTIKVPKIIFGDPFGNTWKEGIYIKYLGKLGYNMKLREFFWGGGDMNNDGLYYYFFSWPSRELKLTPSPDTSLRQPFLFQYLSKNFRFLCLFPFFPYLVNKALTGKIIFGFFSSFYFFTSFLSVHFLSVPNENPEKLNLSHALIQFLSNSMMYII